MHFRVKLINGEKRLSVSDLFTGRTETPNYSHRNRYRVDQAFRMLQLPFDTTKIHRFSIVERSVWTRAATSVVNVLSVARHGRNLVRKSLDIDLSNLPPIESIPIRWVVVCRVRLVSHRRPTGSFVDSLHFPQANRSQPLWSDHSSGINENQKNRLIFPFFRSIFHQVHTKSADNCTPGIVSNGSVPRSAHGGFHMSETEASPGVTWETNMPKRSQKV